MTTIRNPVYLLNVRQSVEKVTANIDRRTEQRLAWSKHVCKALLNVDAANACLVRRAIDLLAAHLESLLTGNDESALNREISALHSAAQGGTVTVPAVDLLALPPKPWSTLRDKEPASRTPPNEEECRELLAKLRRRQAP
jgi:hypothetical protein